MCWVIFRKNNKDLDDYEKSACLAIAIKNNPFFIVTDKIGFTKHTILNSSFAIDVALTYCINDQNIIIDELFNEYEDLDYSKKLLINIIEHKEVFPNDLSNSLNLEVDLIKDAFNYNKKYTKIKNKNN